MEHKLYAPTTKPRAGPGVEFGTQYARYKHHEPGDGHSAWQPANPASRVGSAALARACPPRPVEALGRLVGEAPWPDQHACREPRLYVTRTRARSSATHE